MKKIITLIYKDLVLILNKPGIILLTFVLPLVLLANIGFLMSYETKDLTVYIDKEWEPELFNNHLTGQYKDTEYEVLIVPFSKEEMEKELNKSSSGIFLKYSNEGEPEVIIKGSGTANDIVLSLLMDHLSPRINPVLVDYQENDPSVLVSMVLSILIVMGTISITATQASKEIEDKTIIILKKMGYKISSILLAKMLAITLIEIIFAIILNIPITYIVKPDNIAAYSMAILIVILLSAFIGVVVASLTRRRELQSLIIIFFYLPAILFGQIENQLPELVSFFLKVNPLVGAIDLLKVTISGTAGIKQYLFPLAMAFAFFPVSIILYKRQVNKSIVEG